MCWSSTKSVSRKRTAMEFQRFLGLNSGWRIILETFLSWCVLISLSVWVSHSPHLTTRLPGSEYFSTL